MYDVLCEEWAGELCCSGVVEQREALASFYCGQDINFSMMSTNQSIIKDVMKKGCKQPQMQKALIGLIVMTQ